MDCGPTCLRMIAKHYGKSCSLQTLRDKSHLTKEGVTMLGISDAAESIGFRTKGLKLTWDQLRNEIPFPCIAHWKKNHFVVVYAIDKKGRVTVADPSLGLLKYPSDLFLNGWLQFDNNKHGVVLAVEPTPGFYREEEIEQKDGPLHILHYLHPYRANIIKILLALLTACLINSLFPFITQAIVDSGIGTGSISVVIMLLVAQLMLTIGGMVNNLFRSLLLRHTTTRVSISLLSDFLCKLMKLPMVFFDSKMVSDIMRRFNDYYRIQSFLTGPILGMIIAAISLLIYSVIMASYNVGILIIFSAGSVLYIGWVFLLMKRRRELDHIRFQQASVSQSKIVQVIGGMRDIKLNNCERKQRWEWENNQVRLFKVNEKSFSLGQLQEVGSTFIDQIKNILISLIAAQSVINGNMTLGMMMALQFILGQINAPISQFVGFAQSAQDALMSMERMKEIYNIDDEESESDERIDHIPEKADIIVKNLCFQYDGPNSPLVLDHLNFTIHGGKTTAIVGSSGSGKTTLLKMLLGFYKPVIGEITLGGKRLSEYSIRSWRSVCGSVMQDGFIFSDSIKANIAISEEDPDMDRVRMAACVSNISDWIESLPLGYNTKIGADGQGLSTGQKQRLLIARAIYKDPKYIFLDEATNSLDADNEKAIIDNMGATLFYGRTVLVVAHRLSTVRNADNIVVLSEGHIAECGTHKELMEKRGSYYQLVKNQLELEYE